MADPVRVLLVGGTGMLGRPVARRLARLGLPVRVLARDPDRARTLLPPECEIVPGDVLDESSVRSACEGMQAVYINLATPRSAAAPDSEHRGTPRIVRAARAAGVRHLLKISFQGVPAAAGSWWQIRRKAESEARVEESGLDWTIFQPTWFLESLALFRAGPRLLLPGVPDTPIWWIAGDDYAGQVAEALSNPGARNRRYVVQGPEPLSFRAAGERLAAAWRPRPLKVGRVPMWALRIVAPVLADARYLLDLLSVTFETNVVFEAQEAWDDLGRPRMTVTDYAAYIESTGDVPGRK